MPITEGGCVSYSLPKEYSDMMNYDFCKTMMMAIHNIWGISAEDYDYESISYCEGTGGWSEAFMTACRVYKKDELAKYYCTLPWYDSDIFDGYLSQKFVDYKLLLPKDETDEIARQLNIDSDKIKVCDKCGQYFIEEDTIFVNEEESDEYTESLYCCKKCLNNEDVKPLTYDKNNTLKELLGLETNDYFVCSECGKIHFLYNKGDGEICRYCEYQKVSENINANLYYQECIILNEKYLRVFLPKKFKYEDYECEVIYSIEDDIFYGKITKYNGKHVSDLITFHNEKYNNMRKEFESAVKDYIEFKKMVGKE
jgi:hypothetical protein